MQLLEQALQRRRKELLKEVQEVTGRDQDEPFRTLAGEVSDSGDESVASSLIDTDHAAVGRDLGEIRAIDAALKRIGSGEYGRCIACGEQIARKRLLASPSAARCFPCQDHFEKTHGHENWPLL
jgi:RNA polymerase-binding transcription factor DksA